MRIFSTLKKTMGRFWGFLVRYCKYFNVLLIVLVGLALSGNAFAYLDDFEDYATTSLNGQFDWWSNPGYLITDTQAYSGDQSIFYSDWGYLFYGAGKNYGTSIIGNEEFYFRIGAAPGITNLSMGNACSWPGSWCTQLYIGGSVLQIMDYGPGADPVIKSDLVSDVWYKINIEWNTIQWKYRARIDDGIWTDWVDMEGIDSPEQWAGAYVQDFTLTSKNSNFYIDDISFFPDSSLIITSPVSGSTASTTFPLALTYNLAGENVNKIMTIFESWNVSSTCPAQGSDAWTTEYNADWFFYQSAPFFSPRLYATSTTATTSISVYNLDEYFYNCVKCFFYNEDTASSTFENKCPTYTLNVAGFISPGQPLPIGSWEDYYASHTDAKFPTSTAIFGTITGSFTGIVQKLLSFVNDFKTIFDSENSYAKGTSLGGNVPLARGYLKPINDFFGSLPVSEIFIFLIIVLLVVNVYRIVKTILHLIRG